MQPPPPARRGFSATAHQQNTLKSALRTPLHNLMLSAEQQKKSPATPNTPQAVAPGLSFVGVPSKFHTYYDRCMQYDTRIL